MADPTCSFCGVPTATERLDRFLADQLGLSRTVAARLVADKRVTVAGQVARASRLLLHREVVVVSFPESEPPRTIQPANIRASMSSASRFSIRRPVTGTTPWSTPSWREGRRGRVARQDDPGSSIGWTATPPA